MKNALGGTESLLVLGGGSEIALATARALVRDRTRTVVLAARRPDELTAHCETLRADGATTVEAVPFDATDFDGHDAFVADMWSRFGEFDVVLLAFGVLGDQEEAARNRANAVAVVQANFTGAVSVAIPVAERLRTQGHGTLVIVSSVAAERARKANFVYGSSKAGLDAFGQGLGDALVGSGASVLVVRPGFVHTKMTDGMPAAPLSTTSEVVADAIVKALASGKEMIWVPGPIRPVMSALRHLPRAVFRRLPV